MRNVDFPPVETLSLRRGVVVMIVVPAFTECDQRHQPIVAAVVVGRETSLAKDVRQRVYGEGSMIKNYRADEEGPNQHLDPGGPQTGRVPTECRTQQECRCCYNNRRQ